jgi:putative membrane protein
MTSHLAWKPDPFAASVLIATAGLYLAGLARLRRRGAIVRGSEIAAFTAGWLVLAISLLSPLATLSEWLFSVHMTQHELLMLVAAPLIAIGRPVAPMLWALPAAARRASTRPRIRGGIAWFTSPFVVFIVHALALWIWHAPMLYEAAVLDDRLHLVQHVCFTASAVLFWWTLIHGRYGRLGYGAAVIYIFGTALHSGGLGALLAFSGAPWYQLYVERAGVGGDPIQDQQLAGFIMWVPAGIVLTLFGLGMFAAWLGESERRRRKGWTS